MAERDEQTIHRKPFTDDEIEAILSAARDDEILRGPITTAICTAMRRGDCCLLRWSAVDLEAGFISLKTSKTGETAEIPLLPAFRAELEIARSRRASGAFVWTEAAELYQKAPQRMDKGLRRILVRAGFGLEEGEEPTGEQTRVAGLAVLPVEEVRNRALAAIDGAEIQVRKKNRMRGALLAYLEGNSLSQIKAEFGIPKSTASEYFKQLEEWTGVAVIRRSSEPAVPGPIADREGKNASGSNGRRLKRPSVYGWHSFRVAFVTRALTLGMSEELVRRVTGHTAVEVVRRHYFRPGREEFKSEFEKVMPEWSMTGAKSREERLREVLKGMTAKSWGKDKDRVLELLEEK